MRTSLVRLVVLASILSTLTLVDAGANHCMKIFIYSGSDAVNDPGRGGFDIGVAGCLHPSAHEDTNYIAPGITKAWVIISVSDSSVAPVGGTMTVGSKVTHLTWRRQDFPPMFPSWETQTVDIGSTGNVTATVRIGTVTMT